MGEIMDFQAKNTDEFIVEMQGRLRDNDGCGVTHYNLGSAYVAKGRYVEAEAEFLRAVECSPTLVEAFVQLGGLAMNKGDLDGCLEYNERAIKVRPLFAVPHANVGFVHLQRGEADKAIAALKKAIRQDPKFVQALSSLASAYFMKGELDMSMDYSKKTVAIEPNFGPAYNNMALVHMERGEYAQAKECLDKAVETGFTPHPGMVRELAEKLSA